MHKLSTAFASRLSPAVRFGDKAAALKQQGPAMNTANMPSKEIPSTVSVPLPGTGTKTPPPQSGGIKSSPQGFNSGLIPSKV